MATLTEASLENHSLLEKEHLIVHTDVGVVRFASFFSGDFFTHLGMTLLDSMAKSAGYSLGLCDLFPVAGCAHRR